MTENTTYVIPAYRIPCDGIVVGWEFCYQNATRQNVDNAPFATFYPSVWRLDSSGNYQLIHASTVSFMPQVLSGLTFACIRYNLHTNEVFNVLTNDTVGLYSGDNASQILTANSTVRHMITYSLTGNHSNISVVEDGVISKQFNVAIVAQISECCRHALN